MRFEKYRQLYTLLFYTAALFLVYGWFLDNPFVMDDEIHIVENRHIHDLSNWPNFFTSSSMDSGGAEKMVGIYYKPLLMTHFAVIWNLFGADVVAYRLPNYLLHILNSFLIFNFSLLFMSFGLAFLVGAFFLLHPVNAEAVLYICDMQDILYMFFGLSSLLLASRIKNSYFLFVALSISFWLGLLSKETAGLFLFIVSFYVWRQRKDKIWPTLLSAFWVGVGYLALRYSIDLISTKSHHLLFHQASYLERLQTLPFIWAHYIENLVFPANLSLTADFVIREFDFINFWIPVFVCLLFIVFFLYLKKIFSRTQYLESFYFFIFVFVCWFGLHSHIIIPLDGVYTDRWLYMAVWAFASLIVVALSVKMSVRKIYIGAFIILLGFSARDFIRGQDWASPLRLYMRELKLHPRDATMSNNVGVMLFRNGQWQEAKPYFIKATEFNPYWNVGWNNLGAIVEREGNYEKALELYKMSFSAGDYPLAVENYAKLICRSNNIKMCRDHVKWSLERYPHNQTLIEINRQLQNIP